MDNKTITELIETEVKTAAVEYAEQLFPELSKQIAEQIEEKVATFVQASDGELEREARDLIQPAFLQAVCARLATMLLQSSNGWDTILWSNMKERYDETGEV